MFESAPIRENRDPAFWLDVFTHPQVKHGLHGHELSLEHMGSVLSDPKIRPFASEHGGWLFVGLDPLGRTYDLHAAFTPQGWGREAHATLQHGLEATQGDVYLATLTRHRQSRVPLSFGFRPASDYRPSMLGDVRTWVLTRNAWLDSAARRRLH